MPSPALVPSAAKRGRGPMMQRQLSLQGSTPPLIRPSEKRPGLRRQSSEDLGLIIGSSQKSDKNNGVRTAMTRPKPVRMAWADRKPDQNTPGEVVEVVARRFAGLPRPSSRTRLTPNLSLIDKDPRALTRQQLAERLRRAWRDRERKPNLDIVLAHSRPESASSARSTLSDDIRTPTNKPPMRAVHTEAEDKSKLNIDLAMDHVTRVEEDSESRVDTARSESKKLESKVFLNSAQYRADKENFDVSLETTAPLTASDRRASFRSSQLLNRTIFGSFSEGFDDADPSSGGLKVFLTKTNSVRPPLVRASSAPVEKTNPKPTNVTVFKPILKSPKPVVVERKPMILKEPGTEEDDPRNKEAVRKKLKNVPTRRKPKERDESSEDEDSIKTRAEKKKAPRRRPMPIEAFGGEVITMVSLVSPAESDIEDPILPLALSKTEVVHKEKFEATQCVHKEEEIASQKYVSLRKTNKTVSFQAHPPVSRSCSASFPCRRAPPGASIIVSTPINAHPTQNNPPERQADRGVKRRLTRSRTELQKEDDDNGSSDERTDTSTEAVMERTKNVAQNKIDLNLEQDSDPLEPEVKSPKEKECWALYKKMLDKGVAVSYETVLRPHLGPQRPSSVPTTEVNK